MEGEPTVVRALPRGLLPQTLGDPLWTRRSAVRVGTKGFDVLVAHTCTTAWGLLRAHPRLPLLDVFHADAAEESRYMRSAAPTRRARLSASLLEHPLRRLERRTLRDADAVVVLSEFSRRLLTNLAPDAAATALRVPAGIDTNVFTPDGRDKSRALLGVGHQRDCCSRSVGSYHVWASSTSSTLRPSSATWATCASLSPVKDPSPPTSRSAAGGSAWRAASSSWPHTGRRAPSWYRAADLVVVPSLAHEGFGLVTAEALASGTPVVGSPVGATPELLEPIEPRLVATGTSAAALGDAIRNGLGLATAIFVPAAVSMPWRTCRGQSCFRHGSTRSRSPLGAGKTEIDYLRDLSNPAHLWFPAGGWTTDVALCAR